MCLCRLVAFCVTFNDLCCSKQGCGLLSRIQLGVTDQSCQSSQNEFCITLWSCFCSLLTSKWEVSTGWFLYSCINFSQSTPIFVISSYIDNIETNLPIGKHTLHGFTWYFGESVGKDVFRCFIYVFVLVCCNSCHFLRFMLLNATLWFNVTHTIKINGPKLAD